MSAIEKAIQMGAVEWSKGSIRRFYFNDLCKWVGLTVEKFNSGNISKAWYEGSEISNSAATKIMNDLSDTKIWFDTKTNKFEYKTGFSVKDSYYAEKAIESMNNEFLKMG